MTTGQKYINRKRYIEGVLGVMLSVKPDFGYIKYAYKHSPHGEYMRIADIKGGTATFDITDKSLEDIVEDVCRTILLEKENILPAANMLTDNETLRILAPLFR